MRSIHRTPAGLALTTAAGLAGLALTAAPAPADTLVFVKGQYAYVAQANGSSARPVTPASKWWAWPSESDAGTIAVAGGAGRVNPGGTSESSGGSEIYAFDQQGHSLLATPVNTPGSYSNPQLPTYVAHFRLSPDGSTVAYTVIGCCGASGSTTFLSPLRSGASWTQFQDDYVAPDWLENSSASSSLTGRSTGLLLSHNGPTVTSDQPEYAIFDPSSSANNKGWSGDSTIPDGWGWEAVLAPRTNTLALFLNDAADVGGSPQHVQIELERVGAAPYYAVTPDCNITLPASRFSNLLDISPTITKDGSTLAWSEADGVYEANVSDPTNCSAVTGSVHLVVPGGKEPSFGAAALSASGRHGGGHAGSAPNTRIVAFGVNRKRHSATVRFTGNGGHGRLHFSCRLDHGGWHGCRSGIVLRHLKRGNHMFSVRAVDSTGAHDPSPASKRFRLA